MHKSKTLRVFKKSDQLKTFHGQFGVTSQNYTKNRFADNASSAATYYMDTPQGQPIRKIPHKVNPGTKNLKLIKTLLKTKDGVFIDRYGFQNEQNSSALRNGSSNQSSVHHNMMLGPDDNSDLGEKRLSREYPNVFLDGGPSRAGEDTDEALASRRSAADDDIAGHQPPVSSYFHQEAGKKSSQGPRDTAYFRDINVRDQKATTQANGPKFLNIKDDHQLEIHDQRIANTGMDPNSAILSDLDQSCNIDESLEK